jgi:hypothetical protein
VLSIAQNSDAFSKDVSMDKIAQLNQVLQGIWYPEDPEEVKF